MKKSAYSEQREMIVAEAINPIATRITSWMTIVRVNRALIF